MIVELVLLAGIITGVLLVYFGSGGLTSSQSVGYVSIALGLFCIIGIEVCLAVRSPLP